MPSFSSAAQQFVYETVCRLLTEREIPFGTFDELVGVRVLYGSTYVNVMVYPTKTDAIINFSAMVVRDTNIDDPSLLEFLLRENDEFAVGAFALIEGIRAVTFEYSIFGPGVTAGHLERALRLVLHTADEYDDKISARWGGVRGEEALAPKAPPAT